MFEYCAKTHTGLVRSHNEDSYAEDENSGLWVVADGVGGQRFGEFASQLAVSTVKRKIKQGSGLRDAVLGAHHALLEAAELRPELEGMATTVVVVQFRGSDYEVAWVGDSRAYIVDKEQITQISEDHNQAQLLVNMGEITEQEAQTHSTRHILLQALGLGDDPQVDTARGTLKLGQCMLLCTDGLCGEISDQQIFDVINSTSSIDSMGDLLVKAALKSGGRDNITLTITRLTRDLKPYNSNSLSNRAEEKKTEEQKDENAPATVGLRVSPLPYIVLGVLLAGLVILAFILR